MKPVNTNLNNINQQINIAFEKGFYQEDMDQLDGLINRMKELRDLKIRFIQEK